MRLECSDRAKALRNEMRDLVQAAKDTGRVPTRFVLTPSEVALLSRTGNIPISFMGVPVDVEDA